MATIGIFLAIFLTIFILHKLYAKFCLSNFDISLSVSANTATEGDILTLTEVLTNNKLLPLPWIAVKFRIARELAFATMPVVSDAHYRNDLFHILMHQKITRRLAFTCTKRGYFRIDEVDITGWDVLMLQKYVQSYPTNIHLTVYPGIIPTPEIEGVCTTVYGQLRTRHPINQDPFSFRGIREYSPQDSMRSINFKASARGSGLMTNIHDFTNSRQVAVLLDTQRHVHLYNEYLEEHAIRLVAGITEHLTKTAAPYSFTTNGKSVISGEAASIPEGLGTRHTRTVLEVLAHLDLFNQDITPFTQILSELAIGGRIEPEYWIVTPYYTKEVEAEFLRLKEYGASVAWITPDRKPTDTSYCADVIFV